MKKQKEAIIKIEKGFEMPSPRGARLPWAQLKVGESFEVPDGMSGSARANSAVAGKRHGMKFSVRVQPNGLLRVWRIA